MSKEEVIKAIAAMGNQATVADVMAWTGLSSDVASSLLNSIAAETGGHLAVTASGTILYCFDPGFKLHYVTRGLRATVDSLGRRIASVIFLLFRFSFGLTLIVSIFAVWGLVYLFYAILSVITGAFGAADRLRADFMDILRKLALSELLFFEARKEDSQRRPRGFLLNCFSFLFGEGDPNFDLDERRWKLLAQVIRENEGVVTAELLAPYFGRNPDGDKDFCAVLARFNGVPVVTDKGNIVYHFPSLSSPSRDLLRDPLPACLEERLWQFTSIPSHALRGVYALVTLNFLGSLLLFWYWLHVLPDKQLSGLPAAALLLSIYGGLFLFIPLIRLVTIQVLNSTVKARNSFYKDLATPLIEKSPELIGKLIDAEEFRLSQRSCGLDQVIYTTEKDALEQEF